MLGTEDHQVLKRAYDGVRAANENLRDVQRGISRLMAAKEVFFPDLSRSTDRVRAAGSQAFGGEDAEEWWNRAHRSGLVASKANIDRELEKLSGSRKNLEDILDALRCCINKISRPLLRGLHILELPDEILNLIFEFVEGLHHDLGYNLRSGGKDIESCRLTCRRFCSIASRMLVRLVRVDHRSSSLSRLEEISRHPIISKGVCAVRVLLHSYDSTLSTHIEDFVLRHTGEVERLVDAFESTRSWELAISEETALEIVRKAREVLAAWCRLTLAPSDADEKDDMHRALLEEAHKKYQRYYEEQESLRKGGKFAQIVGSAIARMPCARRLEFHDSDSESLRGRSLIVPGGDVCGAIYRGMLLQPTAGFDAKAQELEPPLYKVIYEVLDAVRSAGAWLEDIDIKLDLPGGFQLLVSGPETREKLSSAVQQLNNFSFECRAYVKKHDSNDLNEFLKPFLDTLSLKRLKLDVMLDESSAISRVGQAILLRPRQNLTDIVLTGVALDLSDLILFLKNLQPSLSRLYITDVYLLSGTWAEALEALREKSYGTLHLFDPRGAECNVLSYEEFAKVFGTTKDRRFHTNQAERYIRRLTAVNPLHALKAKSDNTVNAAI
ncbi:hypothetical protein MMYC01_204782 [Madurella mycetomatis]|uniref:Uncharacterized protein n=1 Tax=Madurella mycetomatis TaxID=100816 RepID=A0A175W2J8_9PEZI|nr:hypothetical protein MMYC01_204782 [Madurella mycetomatis]